MKRRFWFFVIAFALLVLALLGWTVEAMRWATHGLAAAPPARLPGLTPPPHGRGCCSRGEGVTPPG